MADQPKYQVARTLFSRRYETSDNPFLSDPTYNHVVLVDVRDVVHDDTNIGYKPTFTHLAEISAGGECALADKASPTAQEQKDTQVVPLRPSFGAERPHDEDADNVVSADGAALYEEEEADCISSYIPRTLSRPTGAGGVAKAPRSPKKFGEDLPKAGSSNTFESKKTDRLKRLERKQEGSFGS